ncbi:hypothetical protein GG344DRAFT_81940 [Lentinula edodes]|nr:hypothetical protein GG344DRAFT_81940 [Lentinula edodes]
MSSIHLYPTVGGLDPILNNTYKDSKGKVQYVVRTPITLTGLGRITTILKSGDFEAILASDSLIQAEYCDDGADQDRILTDSDRTSINLDEAPVVADKQSLSTTENVEETVVEVEEDRMIEVGKIGWALFKSSMITFGKGPEQKADQYFQKESWGFWGRHRVFTGPDRKEYKWVLGFYTPELILNDGSNTPVARFHRRKFILWNTPPGYLEILPSGVDMIDTILITFIYIEKLRKDKERSVSKTNRAF